MASNIGEGTQQYVLHSSMTGCVVISASDIGSLVCLGRETVHDVTATHTTSCFSVRLCGGPRIMNGAKDHEFRIIGEKQYHFRFGLL